MVSEPIPRRVENQTSRSMNEPVQYVVVASQYCESDVPIVIHGTQSKIMPFLIHCLKLQSRYTEGASFEDLIKNFEIADSDDDCVIQTILAVYSDGSVKTLFSFADDDWDDVTEDSPEESSHSNAAHNFASQ